MQADRLDRNLATELNVRWGTTSSFHLQVMSKGHQWTLMEVDLNVATWFPSRGTLA